jgi:hypothetical protein
MASGSPSYAPLTIGMSPDSLPFEVFEMIVGQISFVDLPRFLQTSKAINVRGIVGTLSYSSMHLQGPDTAPNLLRSQKRI